MEVAATIQHNCAVMVGLCTARYSCLLPCHIAFTFGPTEKVRTSAALIWTCWPSSTTTTRFTQTFPLYANSVAPRFIEAVLLVARVLDRFGHYLGSRIVEVRRGLGRERQRRLLVDLHRAAAAGAAPIHRFALSIIDVTTKPRAPVVASAFRPCIRRAAVRAVRE